MHVPALLARQAQLKGDVVAKVELLLAGQVVGAVKVLDGVVQAIFLQQGFAYLKQREGLSVNSLEGIESASLDLLTGSAETPWNEERM